MYKKPKDRIISLKASLAGFWKKVIFIYYLRIIYEKEGWDRPT